MLSADPLPQQKPPRRRRRWRDWAPTAGMWVQLGEQVAVGLITVGILCMIQPFVLALLAYGFVMVLAGMVLFIVVSHV